ncbi:MAG: phage holin family protein [Coriobacteriia bacterium]|nr:phage holin family protein [Coriobacteriia bacterium]
MGRAIGIWIITAIAVAIAFYLVPGVGFAAGGASLDAPGILGSDQLLPTVVFAAILAIINGFIRPILKVLTLPITIITLGLFALVVNTGMLYLAEWVGNSLFGTNLYINSFWNALLASIIISIIVAILGSITGLKRRRARRSSESQR